jgi:hypothetical protein
MALGGAVAMAVVALPAASGVAYYLGSSAAWSFLYGVFVGVAMFSSIAFAVTMVFGPTTEAKRLVGAGIYAGRLVFAAAAVIVPITLGLWPVVPMLCGFVGVYVVENVALLLAAAKFAGGSSMSGTEG